MLDEENLAYRKHDIELDIDLISRYGTRIPVLYRSDSGEELGWPFSAGQARRFFER